MGSPEIILASASQTRLKLLKSAGVEAQAVHSGLDETAYKERLTKYGPDDAHRLAAALAAAKAESVSSRHPHGLVIGADQLLLFEQRVIDKPVSMEEARQQLATLRGKTHMLVTAVAVARAGAVAWSHSAVARLTMRKFSDEFMMEYLSAVGGDALTSVGAYKIEGRGLQLFDRIEGDFFSILGLPLLSLLSFLRSEGCLRN